MSSVKILHVEDDPVDAMLMQTALSDDAKTCGKYDIVHVDGLKEALEELRQHGYDAVLLDLNLRDVSGTSNISAIKEENPDIPVVVLSGLDNDKVALEAIDSGAQEYISKGHCNGKVIRLAIQSSIRRKHVERQLFVQANYDEITGLPNRRFFRECAEKMIVRAHRWERKETLMFIDIDNFKAVNDEYGHEACNTILRGLAERMNGALRESDMMARYGGDEFVIMLDDRSQDFRKAAGMTATKLLYTLDEPLRYHEHEIHASASIGIAVYPFAGADFSDLIKTADQAMYEAKKAGGRQFRFGGMMH